MRYSVATLTVVISLSHVATGAITDNLVLYLPYDEGDGVITHDMSGNGFHGVLFCINASQNGQWSTPGEGVHWVTGKFGSAIAFYNDGSKKIMDTHVMYEDFLNEPPADLSFSYSFWVRRPFDRSIGWASSWVNQWSLNDGQYTAGDEFSVNWWVWGSGLQYDHLHTRYSEWVNGGVESGDRVLVTAYSAEGAHTRHNLGRFNENPDPNYATKGDGLWHNIIITVQGDPNITQGCRFVTRVYIDGVIRELISTDGQGWGHIPMEALTIGVSEELKGIDINDEIDDVAVWNRVLTPGEMTYIQTHPVLLSGPDCNAPRVDMDNDGDVDQADFAILQRCVTGENDPGGLFDAASCTCLDSDGDNDIDGFDFTAFEACASGPGIAADPYCGETFEACCFGDSCGDMPVAACLSEGGIPMGPGSDCAAITCPQSCCLAGGNCQEIVTSTCIAAGGLPGGAGSTCASTPCMEACCLADGTCQDLSYASCMTAGGGPEGVGTQCATTVCTQSCCFGDGTCSDLPGADCSAQGGTPGGVGTSCATTGCPVACCLPNGGCENLRADVCQTRGGRADSPGTTCATNPCTRACCLPGGVCEDLTPGTCVGRGGTPQAILSECASTTCP